MNATETLRRLADTAERSARSFLARSGSLPPTSFTPTDAGVVMHVGSGYGDHEMRALIAVTRAAGIRHGGDCAAIAISTMHDDGEGVTIVADDGHRQEVREYAVDRRHPAMAAMVASRTVTLIGNGRWEEAVANIHATDEDRQNTAFLALVADLADAGILDGQAVTTNDGAGRITQ